MDINILIPQPDAAIKVPSSVFSVCWSGVPPPNLHSLLLTCFPLGFDPFAVLLQGFELLLEFTLQLLYLKARASA